MRVGIVAASAVALVAFSGSAHADGTPAPYTATVSPYVHDWSGLYVGGQLGYQWLDMQANFTTVPPLPFPSLDSDDGIAGFQVGFQQQLGNVVLGLEAGATFPLESMKNAGPFSFNPAFTAGGEIEEIFYVGPRIGWSLGAWMPYVTGGYARAEIDTAAFFTATGATFWTGEEKESGWYIGGGVDWAVSRGWVLGVDYRHYDFEDSQRIPVSPAGIAVIGDRHIAETDVDNVTLRLSYKFDRDPYRPPLK